MSATAEVFPFPQEPEHRPDKDGEVPQHGRRPRARFTMKEALRAGLCEDKDQYKRVEPVVEMTIDHYHGSDVPRSAWIPRVIAVAMICKFWIGRGQELLRAALESMVDPALDEIAGIVEDIKSALETLAQFPSDIAAAEGNKRFGGRDAVRHVAAASERIELDRANGLRHHDRVPDALRVIARWAPWGEALGFLLFALYFLNVPVFQPWVDWLGWSFAMVLVVGICLGLAWAVHHAAEAHNHGREQTAERQSHEAEKSRRNRLIYGAIAVIAAGGITFGMIERGLTSLAGGSFAVTAVMISLAGITGILLPILTYWGKALDGSTISRERDAMAADLDDDLAAYNDLSSEIDELFARFEAIDEGIVNDDLPHITDDVQSEVNRAREDYLFLLVQLGVDTDLPAAVPVKVEPGATGPIGTISTGLPGGDSIDMQPTWDRMSRLQGLRGEIRGLMERRAAIPPHPWKHSATE